MDIQWKMKNTLHLDIEKKIFLCSKENYEAK